MRVSETEEWPSNSGKGKAFNNVKDGADNENEYDIFYTYRPNNILNKIPALQKITYAGKEIKTVGIVAKLYAVFLASVILVYNYFLVVDLKNGNTLPIIIVIDVLANISCAVTNIVSMLLSAFLVSPFMLRAFNGFKSIDEKLSICGKSNYSYLRTRIMLAQICLILISTSHYIYEYFVNVGIWSSNLRLTAMHIMDLFVYVHMLDFTSVVWIIVTRLKFFNSQLREMTKENENNKHPSNFQTDPISTIKASNAYLRNNSDSLKKTEDEKRAENLLRLMKIFDEIADVANIVSSCYGLSLLFSSTMTFLYIISTVNGLIMFKTLLDDDPNYTVLYVIGWSLPDTIYLLISAYVSETMKAEVEKTNNYIDKLSINTEHGTKMAELIENFSQLLSVREVFITAANFFPFDMTFILSLVGAVATYTVLLMQANTDKPTLISPNNTTFGYSTNATIIGNLAT